MRFIVALVRRGTDAVGAWLAPILDPEWGL